MSGMREGQRPKKMRGMQMQILRQEEFLNN